VAHEPARAESWVCAGNVHSLRGEQRHAMRMFRRALQLQPAYAYAHTLCGHEAAAAGDAGAAGAAYRAALRVDRRQYAAWFGLGQLAARRRQHAEATQYLRRAVELHPLSSVLWAQLGAAAAAAGDPQRAMQWLQRALELNADNTMARFKRATLLLRADDAVAAHAELRALHERLPREAAVCVALAKACLRLGQQADARHYMSVALDNDAKNANAIKKLIDSMALLEVGAPLPTAAVAAFDAVADELVK